MVCGIDYGSKLAGTTSIAYRDNGEIKLLRSAKKQDADKMIIDFCDKHRPELIAIDAPLSLPGVYSNKIDFNDYFYREADRVLRAMSPMFLGGLTARAMRLKDKLTAIAFIEVYPVYRAREMGLEAMGYRSKSPDIDAMGSALNMEKLPDIASSHDFDAVLCLEIAERYAKGLAKQEGLAGEGLIYY